MIKKYYLVFLIFLEYPLVLIARKIAPTDLAGPGLDIPLMFLFLILNLFMFVITIAKWKKSTLQMIYFVGTLLSTFLLIWWFLKPN
jgi:hypothetical protein